MSRPVDANGSTITDILQLGGLKQYGYQRFWIGTIKKNVFKFEPTDTNIELPLSLANENVFGLNAQRTPDNGIIFSVFYFANTITGNSCIYKIDNNNKLVWQYIYPGCLQALFVSAKGSVCLAGHTEGDNKMKVLMLNDKGSLSWVNDYPFSVLSDPNLSTKFTGTLCAVSVNPDDISTISASILSPSGQSTDIAFFRLDKNGKILQ